MKHVRMWRSATPAKQHEHEWFFSFTHRHGDATTKPKNRDETCWKLKTSIPYEASSLVHTFVAARSTFPSVNSKICLLKIDVSYEASVDFHHISRNANQAICALSPLTDNAIRKSMQHDMFKVLRLPRKMKMDTSKVCSCHEKCKSSSDNLA